MQFIIQFILLSCRLSARPHTLCPPRYSHSTRVSLSFSCYWNEYDSVMNRLHISWILYYIIFSFVPKCSHPTMIAGSSGGNAKEIGETVTASRRNENNSSGGFVLNCYLNGIKMHKLAVAASICRHSRNFCLCKHYLFKLLHIYA